MSILTLVRKQPLVNSIGRKVLAAGKRMCSVLERKAYPRWRVSGVVSLEMESVRFNLYAECDDFTVDELYYGKYSENLEVRLFANFALKANCVLDVGANVGLYAILSGVTNRSAQVFAFEPHPTNASRVRKNIEINQLSNVSVIEKAVGAEDQPISLTVPDDMRITQIASNDASFSKQFHRGELSYTNIEVECITLDHFINELKVLNVDLIKIDVENFEMEVFKGASSLFESSAPIVFCEIHMNKEREAFFAAFLEKYNYQMYAFLENALCEVDDLSERYGVRNFLLAKRGKRRKFYPVRNDNMSDLVNTFRQVLQNN